MVLSQLDTRSFQWYAQHVQAPLKTSADIMEALVLKQKK